MRIETGNSTGTGFFIKILLNKKNKYFLFTCFHVITKNEIDSKITIDIYYGKKDNETKKSIKLDKDERFISYYEDEKDATIIEVLEKDNITDDKYLIADLNYKYGYEIYKKSKFLLAGYTNDSVYGKERQVSFGEIKNIYESEFEHSFHTEKASLGGPICLFENIQVIGIHKHGHKIEPINYGTFIGAIIDILKIEYKEIKSEINHEQKIELNYEKIDNINNFSNIENTIEYEKDISIKYYEKLNTKFNIDENIDDEILEDSYNIKLEKLYMKYGELLLLGSEVNFKKLKILHLNGNYISNLTILGMVKFEELNELNLDWNRIYDINILENESFKKLKFLSFYHNCISDINVLSRAKFKNINVLDLGDNSISDITVLDKVNFKELRKLSLYNNIISDIKVLERVKFDKLKLLDLDCNNISRTKFSGLIDILRVKFELRIDSFYQGIYLN